MFDHLTGPLQWNPNWLQTHHVPDVLRQEVRNNLIGQAAPALDEIRNLIYRQYGYLHIDAVLTSTTIEWQRLDTVKQRETTRNGLRHDHESVVFAEKPVHDLFIARLRNTVHMVPVPNGTRATILRAIVSDFLGRNVQRAVFWIGRDFMVEGNRADLDKLLIDLCHVCSTYFSTIQQYIVLPPYARTHHTQWLQALRLLVQQPDVVPFARVAVCPEDLELFERDHRLGNTSPWLPSYVVTEDGHYGTADAVESRKRYLKEEHGLDL